MSQEPVHHSAGMTSVCWAQLNGESVLVSSGHDGTLALRDPHKPAKVSRSFELNQPLHDVSCVSIDAKACVLVAQEDSYAKVVMKALCRRHRTVAHIGLQAGGRHIRSHLHTHGPPPPAPFA